MTTPEKVVTTLAPRIVFYKSHDQGRLAARVWRSEQPLANVICLHGIVSHSGWYESSCSHLAANGFQVHFLDRRGSGLNCDTRGDINDWQTWISDVVGYLDGLDQEFPRIILGISWGGILATCLAKRHPDKVEGLALICPGIFSYKSASFLQRVGLHCATAFGFSNRQVLIPIQEPKLFTNSPKHQRYIAQDPLSLRKITIRFAKQNLQLLDETLREPESIQPPVFLALASGDPITDNKSTRAFLERIGHSDRTVVEYPESSHTLEFEDDPANYFCDLTNWCQRIANQAKPSQE